MDNLQKSYFSAIHIIFCLVAVKTFLKVSLFFVRKTTHSLTNVMAIQLVTMQEGESNRQQALRICLSNIFPYKNVMETKIIKFII